MNTQVQHCNCSTGRLLVSTVLSPGGFIALCWDQGLQALLHPPAERRNYGSDSEPFPDHLRRPVCQSKWPALLAQLWGCRDAWLLGAGRLAAALRRGGYIIAVDLGGPIFPRSAWKRVKGKIVFLNAEWKLVLKIAVEQNDCLPCSSVCRCCTKPNEKLESRISSAPGARTAGNTVCFWLLHHALLSGWTGQKIRVTHRHTGTFWCDFFLLALNL